MYPGMIDIQCDSIVDIMVCVISANVKDIFLRRADRQTYLKNRSRRKQLIEELKKIIRLYIATYMAVEKEYIDYV